MITVTQQLRHSNYKAIMTGKCKKLVSRSEVWYQVVSIKYQDLFVIYKRLIMNNFYQYFKEKNPDT
jgi:hypothetical protein